MKLVRAVRHTGVKLLTGSNGSEAYRNGLRLSVLPPVASKV